MAPLHRNEHGHSFGWAPDLSGASKTGEKKHRPGRRSEEIFKCHGPMASGKLGPAQIRLPAKPQIARQRKWILKSSATPRKKYAHHGKFCHLFCSSNHCWSLVLHCFKGYELASEYEMTAAVCMADPEREVQKSDPPGTTAASSGLARPYLCALGLYPSKQSPQRLRASHENGGFAQLNLCLSKSLGPFASSRT